MSNMASRIIRTWHHVYLGCAANHAHGSCMLMTMGHKLTMQGESKAEFVQRVQQCIADELQIPIVDYNIQQKQQWIQRLRKGSAA